MPSQDIQGRVYAPVGQCIFCGSDGDSRGLRDEHIMPFSLGGNAVLPAASCADCEAITSYIDGYLARNVFYDYRLANDIQSRTPRKKRPTTRTTILDRPSGEERVEFKVGEHPFTTVLPMLGRPGILTGKPPGSPFESSQAHMFYYLPPGFENVFPSGATEAFQIVARGNVNLETFARGLAKIAYCHAVAQGHITAKPSLPITDLIRGFGNFCSYLVGRDTTPEPDAPDEIGVLHRIKFTIDRTPKHNLLAAHIRLFANAGTATHGMPSYFVALDLQHRKSAPPITSAHPTTPLC